MGGRLDRYVSAYLDTVEFILKSGFGKSVYFINHDKQLLNVKPAAFKNILKDKCPDMEVKDCLRRFKGLGFILTEKEAYTSIQWAGRKSERVVAVELEVYNTIRELNGADG